MARYVWPNAEEQIERHIGGPILTDELREELRCSLTPVGIMVKGGQTYYSCCQDYADTVGYHHREYGQCPICGRTAYHIKQCHIRKGERQEQFHFTYRRSIADDNTVLIIGIWVAQIWEGAKYSDPETVPTQVEEYSLIVIPYGGKPARYINETGCWYTRGWSRREKIIGGCVTTYWGGDIERINHTREFNNAIRGTRFEKMMRWVDKEGGIYFTCDHANTLAEIAKNPKMEYMVARGLGELVKDKINHATGAGLVNWRAKTIDKMLPLTSDELGRIKAKGYRFTSAHLMPIKYARQFGQTIKLEDAMGLMSKIGSGVYYDVEKALKKWGNRYGVVKILRYFANRVIQRMDIYTWLDYMEELAQLDCLDDMSMVFPKNLLEMHAQTSVRIKIRESEADQKMLEEILPKLQKKYTFRAGNVVLEPFSTLAEVIQEGSQQSICIGGYAKRYAAGGTILCKMRHVDAPDTPWHAVEFDKNGRMVQCRGHHNHTWAEDEQEVRDFWAAWDKAHKTETKVRIYIEQRRATA